MSYLRLYALTFVIFLVIDMVWLVRISPKLYDRYIGHLLAENANKLAAALFYLIFIAGVVFFVVQPAVDAGSWTRALAVGAFFGLVTYATFDLTNNAVMKDWPATITAIDLAWGMAITATSSAVVTWLALRWWPEG